MLFFRQDSLTVLRSLLHRPSSETLADRRSDSRDQTSGQRDVSSGDGQPREQYDGSVLGFDSGLDPLRRRPGDDGSRPFFRILVIDDSSTVVRAIEGAFARSPCRVETVGHFLEIPRYLRQTPPDLVVLDLNMPGLSGERISDFIRRDQQRDTPILIYSSLPEADLRAAAARTRADGWVSKQAPLQQLVSLVKQTLARRGGGARP